MFLSQARFLQPSNPFKYFSVFTCPVSTINIKTSGMSHIKCRNTSYPRTRDGIITRFHVPDDKVSWKILWPDYSPTIYTMSDMVSKPWADFDIGAVNFKPKWNLMDGNVDRKSHIAEYKIENGYPINLIGRTGIRGRGCLGRWGPNHAADPIVTRWNKKDKIIHHEVSKLPILQFVAIERKDCGEWAIPGGMVDPGEVVSVTVRREFFEEALDSLSLASHDKEKLEEKLKDFFSQGYEIYRGYVDDPRNTDNAWMETVVYHFHDDTGNIIGNINLQAGDDAAKVRWIDVSSELQLYASHKDFLHAVTMKLGAHW